jgi:hypothetical protein
MIPLWGIKAIAAALAAAALIAGYLAWAARIEQRGFDAAMSEVRAAADAQNEAQREIEKTARKANDKNQDRLNDLKEKNTAARIDLARAGERLRIALAAAASSAASQSAGAAERPDAGRVADLLGQCSAETERLAGEADRLAIKVTGLQGYVRDVVAPVCLGAKAPQ